MTSPRALLLAASLVASITGCNFILNPTHSDDVIRCKNATECERADVFAEVLAEGRTNASCDAPGSGGGGFTSSKTNQVCSLIDRTDVSCDPTIYMAGPFYDAWASADFNKEVYTACTGAMKGSLGCPPTDSGSCTAPLKKNALGFCDDGKGVNPLYGFTTEDQIGQDVKDQHCRSYFCSEEFVCNNTGSSPKCARCDPDAKVGEGGCGELAFGGKRSSVYQDDATLADKCLDVANADKTDFGAPVTAP